MDYQGKKIPFENIFQSSKVFENGGPYRDLLHVSSKEAKKDYRLRNSGKLIAFDFDGKSYPLTPMTAFFDYLYCKTLFDNPALWGALYDYSFFTDIELNPKRSKNCQARSVAIFLALERRNVLEDALSSFESFVEMVKTIYPNY